MEPIAIQRAALSFRRNADVVGVEVRVVVTFTKLHSCVEMANRTWA
jgi:hypothetical protein